MSDYSIYERLMRLLNFKNTTDRLLIIGNGFDRQCGLESSFNYFLNSKNVSRDIISNIGGIYTFITNVLGKTKDGSVLDISSLLIKNIVPIDIHKQTNNFWLLYFKILKKINILPNDILWNDVESQITFLCKNLSKYKYFRDNNGVNVSIIKIFLDFIDSKGKSRWQLTDIHKDKNGYYIPSQCIDFLIYDYNANRLMIIAIITAIKYCNFGQYCKESIKQNKIADYLQIFYNFLFKNLYEFEAIFAQYLRSILNGNKKYLSNRKVLLKKLSDNRLYSLLTFNYTGKPNDTKCKEYLPIHSDIDHHPIIGVSDEVSNNTKFFEFSKFFRVMSINQQKSAFNIIPKYTDYLIFYGQSLSSADYPYFKYIFDRFNMKFSNVKLIFYYTNYDQKWDHKFNVVKSIYKLLNKYDKKLRVILTMERRLKIKEIKL